MPKVPVTDCAAAAAIRVSRPPFETSATPSGHARPADSASGSTVSQICLKDISLLKTRSAELLGMLLPEQR